MTTHRWTATAHAAAIAAFSLVAGVAHADLVDDLVFAYDMETIDNSTVSDISGNDHHATMAADLTTATIDPLPFSSQHLRTPATGNTASLTSSATLTQSISALSFSIFIHDRNNGAGRVRFLTSYPGAGGWGTSVLFDTDNAGGGQKEIRFFVEGQPYKSDVTIPFASDTWQHFGVVFDNGSVTFYLNGVQHGTAGSLPGAITTIQAQTQAWTLMNYPNDPNSDYIPNADYDEAALWYRALSDQEMLNVYNQGLAALVPEPTSLALLTLAGVFTLARRR